MKAMRFEIERNVIKTDSIKEEVSLSKIVTGKISGNHEYSISWPNGVDSSFMDSLWIDKWIANILFSLLINSMLVQNKTIFYT